jgi:selenocysteine-specific elongation factor
MNHPIVVGTAGHIDHGKTSLVRALTGVDLDTPARGAGARHHHRARVHPLRPAGRAAGGVRRRARPRAARAHDDRRAPPGVDAVLLCVSAVDGVMPQTREHLAILDLLGVRHGVVVLTMADLVDEELLELARRTTSSTVVRGTCLEGRPVLPFSAITGAGER